MGRMRKLPPWIKWSAVFVVGSVAFFVGIMDQAWWVAAVAGDGALTLGSEILRAKRGGK